MSVKKLLAFGAVSAVGYKLVQRVRSSNKPEGGRRMMVYPKRVYEKMEERVLYESSTVEAMFPYMFHTPDVEVYGPNDYPAMAVIKELLEDVTHLDSWSEVKTGEYHLVTGTLTVTVDEDTEFYQSRMETDAGTVFSAFGSVENYEQAVQDAVDETGEYVENDVTAIVEVQDAGETPENSVHFHALVRSE